MFPQGWIGKQIGGRYQIENLLGQGGMSAVYRASDPNLRRTVAIKLIHSHLSDNPRFIERFKEEAAAVARLRHPNIVQVFDFNVDGDTYYMVMEYLTGETLQDRLARLYAAGRYLSFPEVLQIGTQICEAAGYAHNHDLIHRDIKPANIMLDLNGQAILMDFGIVKIVGGEYHTATGATVGTATYMSPEQIRGERIDQRSDIYSLGVTLYEMLSGRPPYRADSAMTLMMMVLNDPLPDIRNIRKGIPEDLLVVVEKALAKDRSARFQSMSEMADLLQQVQRQPESARPLATLVDATKIEPQQPQALPTQGSDAVEAPPPPRRAEQAMPALASANELPVEPAFVLPRAGAPVTRIAAGLFSRRTLIAVAGILLLIMIVAGSSLFMIARKPPDLRLQAVRHPPVPVSAQNAQLVVNLGGWETGSVVEALAFSPDSTLLGTANHRDLGRFYQYRFYSALWRVDAGSLQRYLLGHTQRVNGVAFSPDGQLFASASDDGAVDLWQTSDGKLVRKIEAVMGGITDVDFSPNNLLLATGSWDGIVGLWQLSDGHLLRTMQGPENSVRDVEFSPDGNLLASASDDQTIRVWRVSDGSLLHSLQGHTAQIYRLAFSPDGTLLASASEDHAIGMWQVNNGNLLKKLLGHSEIVTDVAFSPDGSLLASGSLDQTLRLWRVSDGQMLQMLQEQPGEILSLAFSPDGRLLVSGSGDGLVQFWGISEAIPQATESAPAAP